MLDGPLTDAELAQLERTLEQKEALTVFLEFDEETALIRLLLRVVRTERRRRQFAPIDRPRMLKAGEVRSETDG